MEQYNVTGMKMCIRDRDINAAEAVYEGIMSVIRPRGIFLAAQCCEHLNRAVIVEKASLPEKTEIVNVVPQPKAGGSFATTMYHRAEKPVAVESIRADAGMDIGDTPVSYTHLPEPRRW